MIRIRTICLFLFAYILWCNNLQSQNAITYWKEGVPTTIYNPDSVVFWNEESYIPDFPYEGADVEPTMTENVISEMTNNEEEAAVVNYTEEDSLRYDGLAMEVIRMFSSQAIPANVRKKAVIEDELAMESIRNNGKNIFENKGLIIEQQDWNSGLWGKIHYGGFQTFYNTFVENGRRYLEVVFYYKGGFPNKKIAYLKLGQLNSGKILGKVPIYATNEYAFLVVCIDDYLKDSGCVNFFPLLITEASGARNYLNPIFMKSDPIVSSEWRNNSYGDEFGTINGVSVYCNSNLYDKIGKKNIWRDGDFQCTELCWRYVTSLNSNITRKPGYGQGWGNAKQWPEKRQNDDKDQGKYIVFANDGNNKVREGDLIIWDYGSYGHIGVVIKTAENYISVAHQNGGDGKNALPIGSTLKIENGIVKDVKPGSDKSSIFASSKPISSFIRINSTYEDVVQYASTMVINTTYMEFGEIEVGSSVSKSFTITNSGYTMLNISEMKLRRNSPFSLDVNSCTIAPGETRTFTVTFAPTMAGLIEDPFTIVSDAADNPVWRITLNGTGVANNNPNDIPTEGLVAYYPFNGNANDESGYGNHGTVIGNVTLTTDRHGNSNSAYRFEGQPLNYISVPDHESLHLSTFTLSAWVFTDADNYDSGYLINKGRDIYNGSYRLTVTGVGAQTEYGGTNDAFIKEYPKTNIWHMVTGTVEGDQAKFYLDGVLMDEKTLSHPFVYNNTDPLTLGMHYYDGVPDYWAYPLLGVLDEVRIYNRVLSESEIKCLYGK